MGHHRVQGGFAALAVALLLALTRGGTDKVHAQTSGTCGTTLPLRDVPALWFPGWPPVGMDIVEWSFDSWPSQTNVGTPSTNWGRQFWALNARMAMGEWNNVAQEQVCFPLMVETGANGQISLKALSYSAWLKKCPLVGDTTACAANPGARGHEIEHIGHVVQIRQVDIWVNKGWNFVNYGCVSPRPDTHDSTALKTMVHEYSHALRLEHDPPAPGGCGDSVVCYAGPPCTRAHSADKAAVRCLYQSIYALLPGNNGPPQCP